MAKIVHPLKSRCPHGRQSDRSEGLLFSGVSALPSTGRRRTSRPRSQLPPDRQAGSKSPVYPEPCIQTGTSRKNKIKQPEQRGTRILIAEQNGLDDRVRRPHHASPSTLDSAAGNHDAARHPDGKCESRPWPNLYFHLRLLFYPAASMSDRHSGAPGS
jgi:hypothetical protein